MRFLNDGAYVQMAITGQGYCASVSRAFELIMNNAIRVGITDGISIFFTIIGILAVTASVAVGSYFAVTYIPYYQSRISSPFPVVFMSGMIGLTASTLYLAMIDISEHQCFNAF